MLKISIHSPSCFLKPDASANPSRALMMKPLLRREIAVITGGHLKGNSAYNAWLPELKEVEGLKGDTSKKSETKLLLP